MPGPNTLPALDREQLAALCRRWHIRELAPFGPVLRDRVLAEAQVQYAA